jgi:hypothetical protein
MTRILHVLALVLFLAGTAAAQSIYVAGGVGADIVLASGQESIGLAGPSGGGESVSGAARLGTVLNDRFGVELEVSRAAELRESSRPGINPLAAAFPFVFELDSRTRVTTISTTASIRQQVSDNVALAYLGGVVFHRTDSQVAYEGLRATSGLSVVTGSLGSITSRLDPISPVGLVLPFSRIETVQYGAGPVVGFEAHIGVGEHFTIIPGVRMHGLPASWLLRPAVAAGWRF